MTQAIYEPSGRAMEYSLLACNLYWGCTHGCKYCFAPGVMRQKKEEFHRTVKPKADILKQLEKDAAKHAGTDKRVLLCFTCDPYNPEAVKTGITRRAIEILVAYDVPFQVLTKGGMMATSDFSLYTSRDAFAETFTTMSSTLSKLWEPQAALPVERWEALVAAKHYGIETWVSLEPVLDPNESLKVIYDLRRDVKMFKIGKLNHDPKREQKIDWAKFGWAAVNICDQYGLNYYIKHDLLAQMRCMGDISTLRQTDNRKVVR